MAKTFWGVHSWSTKRGQRVTVDRVAAVGVADGAVDPAGVVVVDAAAVAAGGAAIISVVPKDWDPPCPNSIYRQAVKIFVPQGGKLFPLL